MQAVRVIYPGGPGNAARVVDAETGELIRGVKAVRWEVAPGMAAAMMALVMVDDTEWLTSGAVEFIATPQD